MTPTSKLVDGTLYIRSAKPSSFDIRVHDLGNGHVEACALPHYQWAEADPSVSSDALMAATHIWQDGGWVPCSHPPAERDELLDRIANRERSTRRARTHVRRLAKYKGLNTLLTLTYRENVTDRARMMRDLDVFLKRVRRLLPHFEYVCVLERQKRGAWHAHLAVKRILPLYMHQGKMVRSYNLLRSMWRGVVGADNGNIDVSRNKRINRSAARMAVYLSKYIGKTFDQAEKHINSYSASGRGLPAPTVLRVLTSDQNEAAHQLVELLSRELGGSCELYQAFLDGGGYYLCLSPPDGL